MDTHRGGDITTLQGRPAEPIKLRAALHYEPTSDDGRVDWVAVDQALRGWPTELNRYESDEVCQVLYRLWHQYHENGFRGNSDEQHSPFFAIRVMLINACGPGFLDTYERYRDKIRTRERRARLATEKNRGEA